MPRATTIRDTDIPAAVARVKAKIRDLMKPSGRAPLKFSLAIDGGSSKLANGRKAVTVTALSPELQHDIVLGLELRVSHEDAVSQAELIVQLLTEYELKSADAVYLVGDNVAVNSATVDLLRSELAAVDPAPDFTTPRAPRRTVHLRCPPTCRQQVPVEERHVRPLPPALPQPRHEGVPGRV